MRAAGLEHHDVDEGRAQTRLVRRGLRRPAAHLAEYTARLTEVFEKHGTRGTWYAHASEGCLHVRPVLNLKLDKDVKAMRAIAEEAFALVRAYKGSHSGEHGDGIVRSEFHESMFGSRLVRAFEEVKDRFDPGRPVQSGKNRARAAIRRSRKVPVRAELSRRRIRAGAGLVRLSRSRPAASPARSRCATTMANAESSPAARCARPTGSTRDERDVTRGRANSLASGDFGTTRRRCAGVRRDGAKR